jgi:hypothetical protein
VAGAGSCAVDTLFAAWGAIAPSSSLEDLFSMYKRISRRQYFSAAAAQAVLFMLRAPAFKQQQQPVHASEFCGSMNS